MHPKMQCLHDVIATAIDGMSLEQLGRHPEGKWSTAEILEHLNLTYTGTIKNLERCLAAGEPSAPSRPQQSQLRRFVVTRLGYMPSGRKSPERVLPRGMPAEQVRREILENIARMDDLISRCEKQFPPRKPIANHPALGPLTAAEWRGFHLTHGKHHARQIAKLRRSI